MSTKESKELVSVVSRAIESVIAGNINQLSIRTIGAKMSGFPSPMFDINYEYKNENGSVSYKAAHNLETDAAIEVLREFLNILGGKGAVVCGPKPVGNVEPELEPEQFDCL